MIVWQPSYLSWEKALRFWQLWCLLGSIWVAFQSLLLLQCRAGLFFGLPVLINRWAISFDFFFFFLPNGRTSLSRPAHLQWILNQHVPQGRPSQPIWRFNFHWPISVWIATFVYNETRNNNRHNMVSNWDVSQTLTIITQTSPPPKPHFTWRFWI